MLKKVKIQNKPILAKRILLLKERRWNKENIILSDIIKENRETLDSFLILKYLNSRLKLQEHFNWLTWAVGYFYFNILFSDVNKGNFFTNMEEIGLPPVDHIDW